MSRLTKISLLILFTLCLATPNCVRAQVPGVKAPERNAMENMYQNPQTWSGARFAEPHSLLDRLYVNLGGNVGALWNQSNKLSNSTFGHDYIGTIGYRIAPVHLVEVGYHYGQLGDLRALQSLEFSYLFDMTSYASRLEEPGKWQLFFKTGADVGFTNHTSLALNGAVRAQYNVTPSLGIYIEPKMSFGVAPSYTEGYNSKTTAITSLSFGLSFNMGNIVDSYKRMRSRYSDSAYDIVPCIAIKSNLLYDAASVLNIELEVPIKNRWSIVADHHFPWWTFTPDTTSKSDNRLQLLNANIEGRYWFGDREKKAALTGWFAGLYAGGGIYDIEFNSKGYQGEFYITSGLGGGYAHAINKKGNLRMEYAMRVGYMQTDYRYYESHKGINNTWHPIRKQTGQYSWFGPTHAKVSLVWLLNRTKLKGGSAR